MTDPYLKARLRPVIRLFVSSTFGDMRHERNALQEHVFPKLEQLCQKNSFRFQAIDLRWGVSSEAGLDHRTMRICFDELRRAQEISPRPNFLILLGNRYGWRPLPEEISEREFEELKANTTTDVTDNTDGESGRGQHPLYVLKAWYRRDENADPSAYILQSRRQDLGDEKDYTEDEHWNKVQAVLWEIINRAMPPERMRGRFDETQQLDDPLPPIVRFQASATEQEIWQGALRVPDAHEHVLAFFREIEDIGELGKPTQPKDFVDLLPSGGIDATLKSEQEQLKTHLRGRLDQANVFEARATMRVPATESHDQFAADVTTDHLGELCSDVGNRLTEIIQGQIDRYWQQTKPGSAERAKRELEIEQQEHARASQERGGAEAFVGREGQLEKIRAYLHSDSTWPLVVHGPSGCGKTALLSRAAQEAVALKPVVRLIGIHPRCSDVRGLLSSLCQELRLRCPRDGELPTDIKLLEVELHEHCQAAAKSEQPLILFLDALDQLADTDGGRNLHWIPVGPLPAHVKLVASCLSDRAEGDPAGQPHAELRRRQLPVTHLINLDAFSEDEARTLLFKRWLPQAGRTVSSDQRHHIEQRLKSAECRQPIYLKLLFEEVRLWRSYEATPDVGQDVPALLDRLFERLCRPANHGQLLVERVLGYLAASRYGLAENEILEVLFADPEYKAKLDDATKEMRHDLPASATRIPIAIWSRLRFDLAPYLTERAAVGANVLTFYHRQVAEWVQAHFATAPGKRWQPHQLLADYFHDLADPEKNQSWRGDNPRPFLQVVFHLVGAERSDEYCQTLCDLRFVEARCRVGQVFELIADYRLAEETLPEAQAEVTEERQRHERIAHWTREIITYAQAWSEAREHGENGPCLPAVIASVMPQEREEIERESRRISEQPTRLERVDAFAQFLEAGCYELQAFGHLPGFVCQHAFNHNPTGPVHAAAACLRPTAQVPALIRQWSPSAFYNPRPSLRRTLVGRHAVDGVSLSLDGRLAVSSGGYDRTLRIWNLMTGQCLCVLEGDEEPWAACLSHDGRRVTSVGRMGMLRCWDIASGAVLYACRTYDPAKRRFGPAEARAISQTPDGRMAIVNGDAGASVWDLMDGQCVRSLPNRGGNAAEISPDGRIGFTGDADGKVRLWNLTDGTCQKEIWCGRDRVLDLALSNACQRLLTVTMDSNEILLSDVMDDSMVQTLRSSRGVFRCAAMTPDARYALSGAADGTLGVWDLSSGTCLRVLSGHSGKVNAVAVTVDFAHAVSAGEDGTVRVWGLERGEPSTAEREHRGHVTATTISADGRRAASAGQDGRICLWGTGHVTQSAAIQAHSVSIGCLALSPDGRRLFSGAADGTVKAWRADTGTLQFDLGHWGRTSSIPISLDVTTLIDSSLSLELRAAHLAASIDAGIGRGADIRHVVPPVRCLALGADHPFVCAGSQRGVLLAWDPDTGEFRHRLIGHGDLNDVDCVDITPDGRWLVSGSANRTISLAGKYESSCTLALWDITTGACLRSLEKDIFGTTALALTPDGLCGVSTNADGTVRLWHLPTGTCMLRLKGHTRPPMVVRVSPCGRFAISAGQDGLILVWDLRSGEGRGVLEGHSGYVRDLRFSADGKVILSAGDRTVRVWDLGARAAIAVFFGEAPITSMALAAIGALICGTALGEVVQLDFRRSCCGPAIVTALHPHSARCPVCCRELQVPATAVKTIERASRHIVVQGSPCLSLPDEAFSDPALLATCPHCQHPLQFNPFFSVVEDYADVLHRGLEFSRRAKGPEHEETLAHLVALAVHLENAGKLDEAAKYRRQHDEITARAGAKK